jgi:catechol 2,3-dioxygenase-like lactoylglutathione lyase family enzyme
MKTPLSLRQILLPTTDLDASLAFYEGVLGLPLKFRDGDRYAALSAGDATLALLGPADRDPAAGVAPALRAAAVEPLAERLREAGWAVEGPHDGGHERRIELSDPSGNPLVVYAPLPD